MLHICKHAIHDMCAYVDSLVAFTGDIHKYVITHARNRETKTEHRVEVVTHAIAALDGRETRQSVRIIRSNVAMASTGHYFVTTQKSE